MAYKRDAREEMAKRSGPTWFIPKHVPDIHTGEPWSEMVVEDLQAAWKTGADLGELSTYRCHDRDDITQK